MGSKRKHQGIYSLVSEKSLLDLFERDGQQLSRWSRDAKDFIGELGYLLYDTPADAHKILTKGATLFRQRDASTYILCHLIYKEIKKKKNKSKAMRNIIDINLEKYCNAGLVGVPYSQVDHSLTDLRKGKKRKQGSEPRDKVLDRIVEKYRRLVINNPKKFKEYLKQQSKK